MMIVIVSVLERVLTGSPILRYMVTAEHRGSHLLVQYSETFSGCRHGILHDLQQRWGLALLTGECEALKVPVEHVRGTRHFQELLHRSILSRVAASANSEQVMRRRPASLGPMPSYVEKDSYANDDPERMFYTKAGRTPKAEGVRNKSSRIQV